MHSDDMVATTFWRRSHYLDRMTLGELVHAYFRHYTIMTYLTLTAAAIVLWAFRPASAAQTIAAAGTPLVNGAVNYQFNATKITDKKDALQKVINNLATCLYDVNAALDPTMTLSYANPLTATEVDIAHVDACNGDAKGWTADTSDAAHPRVKLCGGACTDYQKVLSDTSTFTLLYSQSNEPVPLYAVTSACFTKK